MAKPSAGFHTPRPTSLRSASAARSSVGSSSSAPKLPAPTAIPRDLSSHAKVTSIPTNHKRISPSLRLAV